MDIFIYTDDRKEVIKLPVIPSEIMIKSPQKNDIFESISMGELKLIGTKGLKAISLSSFFPVKDYPFLKDRTYKGFEYVNIIEKWRDNKKPLRLIITETNINIPITIDDFEYGINDGSGDVYYTLSISEYRYYELKTVAISQGTTISKVQQVTANNKVKRKQKKAPNGVYIVKPNDTYWSIARKLTGRSSRIEIEELKQACKSQKIAKLEPGVKIKV